MLVRMSRDYNPSPDVSFTSQKVYDFDKQQALKLIADGAGVAVSVDSVYYRADAVAITGGTIAGITTFAAPGADNSGAPGNTTIHAAAGKAAIAATASTVVVTNNTVAAADRVFVSLEGSDATATSVKRVTPAAGSFTVEVNAATTAALKFSFFVVKAA